MDGRPAIRGATLVWIDADEAIIVRWADRATVERVRAEDGSASENGDGRSRAAAGRVSASAAGTRGARARHDGLHSFLARVALHVPDEDDVHVVGPGTLRSRLERYLREQDRAHGRRRVLRTAAADRLSERELVAHLRELAGDAPAPELAHR